MSGRRQSTVQSWLPQTNSTQARRTPITDRAGVQIRLELDNPTPESGATVVDWGTARDKWATYIKRTRGTSLRFDTVDGSKTAYHDSTHRWSPDYQEARYAQLKDMERGIDDYYGSSLWTGMVTLTASSDGIAPADHLLELLEGRRTALSALRRSLSDRTWDYWWVLEPHKSGYLHLHLAVVVDGPIVEAQLQPAVDSHLRNCEPAGPEAHEDAIDIRPGREIGNLAAYLTAYLGDYRNDPLEAPENVQRANALLWGLQKRETGASRRLRAMMQADNPEPDKDWELTAVVDSDGEERPVDTEVPGSVDTIVTEVVERETGPPD